MIQKEVFNKFEGQKNKRMIFAQDIRKRNRQEIIQKIRVDQSIRQQVRKILFLPQVDSFKLYNFMSESKINQSNSADVISQWLIKYNPILSIRSKKECLHWGYALATVTEYRIELAQQILLSYLPIIANFSYASKDLQIVYALLCTILNGMENSNEMEKNLSVCMEKVIPNILRLSKQLYNQMKMGSNEIKLYNRVFKKYIQICQNQLLTSLSFFKRICNCYEQNLLNPQILIDLTRLMIFITFYDDTHLELEGGYYPTEQLIKNQIMSHIKFVLQFVQKEQNQLLVTHTFFLLENIVQNGYLAQIVEENLCHLVQQLINDQQNIKSNKIKMSCCLFYLRFVENLPNQEYFLTFLRQSESIKSILFILQKFGLENRPIEEATLKSIENLLKIGEEIRQLSKSSINPYLLKLKYENIEPLFSQSQQFQYLIQYYTEKQKV